jgi:hypothetical protein
MSQVSGAQNDSSNAYRRMFFVGLGGSGGKTLRFLKRDLNRWLKSRGWDKGIPQGWQFLHIDTPTVADGAEITSAPMLPSSEYLGLVDVGDTLEDLDRALFPPHSDHRHDGRSWRVVPQSVHVNIQVGAGQYRAIGRSVALAHLAPIRAALRNSLDQLNQPDAQASLNELYSHVHSHRASSATPAPIFVVASSLAGGTGAGLINDVCDLLRELDPDAGESFGILYTPEVFWELMNADAGAGTGGMAPNSLAAFSELLNGHWWHGGAGGTDFRVPMKRSAVMRSAGAIQGITRTGPAYPFLVGRRNSSGISYETSIQLFEIVGAALATWATDTTVQSEFLAYTVANWRQSATALKVTPHAIVNKGNPQLNEAGLNAFNALGFARVSLGNRYFANYAAERLSREAIDFMNSHHLRSGEAINLRARQPQITPEELIDRQAEQFVDTFLRECRLNEIVHPGDAPNELCGASFTAVEAAIRPSSMSEHLNTVREEAVNQVRVPGSMLPGAWMERIRPAVRDAAEHFESLCEADIESALDEWIKTAPANITSEVTKLVGRSGLPIATAVLQKVAKKLVERNGGVISRLREEITRQSTFIVEDYWAEQASVQFDGKKSKRIEFGPVVEAVIDYALWLAVYRTGRRIKEISADLVEQLVSGFIEPLAQRLGMESTRLSSESRAVRDWPNWPTEGIRASFSDSCTPPMSEYTLLNQDEFPQLFSELLEKTVPAGPAEDHVRRQVSRSSVIVGEFLDQLNNGQGSTSEEVERNRPVVISGAWAPDVNKHLRNPRAVSTAVFSLGFGIDAVRDRAMMWLNRPHSAFGALLGSSLRSYLDDQSDGNIGVRHDEIRRRQNRFMAAFESAVEASKPLVDLDHQLMSVLYPGQNNHPFLTVEVSTLPFAGHDLEDVLTQRLRQLTGKQGVGGYFEQDGQISQIDITTSLEGPYPVIAVSSLLAPIAEAWESMDAGRRADFWDKRRARTLAEFIPAPQEHILTMLRGWFLGRALGLVITSRTGGSFEVAPRGLKPGLHNRELPRVLLSSSDKWGDEPAVVLESMGLAYAGVGVENSLEPLAAYINLFELGRSGVTDRMDGTASDNLSDYRSLGDFVVNWIENGSCALESGVVMDEHCLVEGTDPDSRRSNLAQMLRSIRESYDNEKTRHDAEIMANDNALTLPPYWPSLHPLIDKALEQLINAISPTAGAGGPKGAAQFLPRGS